MSGIKDLDILLSNMEPVLDKRDFVFCSFPTFDWDKMRELNPVGVSVSMVLNYPLSRNWEYTMPT